MSDQGGPRNECWAKRCVIYLQVYLALKSLPALMTINYPVVLLLVYREGGNERGIGRRLFHPFFVRSVRLSVFSRRLQFGASIAPPRGSPEKWE